eukprot:jgi/Psemu1/22641/gm1.22641_g
MDHQEAQNAKLCKDHSIKMTEYHKTGFYGNDTSVLSIDQKPPIQQKPKDIPRASLVNKALDQAITRATANVINDDINVPCSPDSMMAGKDAAHFLELPIQTMRKIAGAILKGKSNTSPEDVKRAVNKVFPFPSNNW